MVTIVPDNSNTIFNIAVDLVNQSSRNIFLTGKAGTGKTTFLKYIRQNCFKQMAVTAPTGVAAINAGGVTLHSFFQLPFSPFVPESEKAGQNDSINDPHTLLSRLRLTSERIKVMQELELLIIDEISMVRCDTLDAIDIILRHVRHRKLEKFGGVQLLFIGDMYQLPPVVRDPEWQILSAFYKSPYFFDSRVILEDPPVYVEFTKIYRQSEERFITLLNQVRNNELDDRGADILESRFLPAFKRTEDDGYIILTTHNRKADLTNGEQLQKINEKLQVFDAEITGEFSEKAYPAEIRLILKTGSQVMFLKNDSSDRGRRYFNGKIGKVSRIEEDKILVKCPGESEEIEVTREIWQNIHYSVNKTNFKIEEDVLGSFTQYPLRLAWAITIHKSQGLTFEKAIIDAEEAFAAGQVYVALSRCTSLSGMVLKSKIRSSGLSIDKRIVAFSRSRASNDLLESELKIARKNYQLTVLISVFDFALTIEIGKALFEYLKEHKSSFNAEILNWLITLQNKINDVQEVGIKFNAQLKNYFLLEIPESSLIQDRIKAASGFFKERLNDIINFLNSSVAVTDSRLHAKEYNNSIKELFMLFSLKKYLMQGLEAGFLLEDFQQWKRNFITPAFTINAYSNSAQHQIESPHPSLHMQLRKLRDTICSKSDLPLYIVAGSNTLNEMSSYLPQTLTDLRKISGFGEAKIEKYGQRFLDIILDYCNENKLETMIDMKKAKKEKKEIGKAGNTKIDTKAETFRLYGQAMSVSEIATARKLTRQTIEGHLAHFIRMGDLNIEELISREKLVIIEPVLKEYNGNSIKTLKEKLGSSIGFGEIKLAIAWQEFQKSKGL